MSVMAATTFISIRNALKSMGKLLDIKELYTLKEQILAHSPDVNTLALTRLFNLTVERIKPPVAELAIDIEHITNLIALRKAAILAQSVIDDIASLSYHAVLLEQIDWAIYQKAYHIANNEPVKSKRRFYIDYFNKEVLGRLIAIKPELEQDRLEYRLNPAFLAPLHDDECIVTH